MKAQQQKNQNLLFRSQWKNIKEICFPLRGINVNSSKAYMIAKLQTTHGHESKQQENIKSWWKNIMQISFPLIRFKLSNSKIQMDGTIQLTMKAQK